ncbi:MAG: DUF4926 domain-containing protein [Phormidesmis sp. CAN_BIN36]|nr:DUF4926 domain-containing protein [Phormidesmis sp. CAN_BIN36]
MKPALFDGIELVVDLPEDRLTAGARGAIIEDFGDGEYEVEFANSDGETLALCTLIPEQFIVVWRAETKSWTSVSKQIQTS